MAPRFALHARQPLMLENSREAHDEQAAALQSFTSGCPGAHHWAAAAARLSRRRRSTCSVSCGSWKKANRFEVQSMHGRLPRISLRAPSHSSAWFTAQWVRLGCAATQSHKKPPFCHRPFRAGHYGAAAVQRVLVDGAIHVRVPEQQRIALLGLDLSAGGEGGRRAGVLGCWHA